MIEMGNVRLMSRNRAAEIFEKLAFTAPGGVFPDDVTCKELGEALHRIAGNSNESDPLVEIIRGWREAEQDLLRRS